MKYITHILAFVAGAVIIATAFLGYTFYKALGTVAQDHAVLVQVIDLINKSQASQQK